MAKETAGRLGLWCALLGSACTVTAMILNGTADGWDALEESIAVAAGIVVVGISVELVRQHARDGTSDGRALAPRSSPCHVPLGAADT